MAQVRLPSSIFSVLSLLTALFYSTSGLAVDGYKGIKFNTSSKAFIAMKMCNVKKGPETVKDVGAYSCRDLKVAGKNANGMFFFLKDQLKRIVVDVGTSPADFFTTFKALKEKYGENYEGLASGVAEAFDAGKIDELTIPWEKEGIMLTISRSNGSMSVMVLYSASDYDEIYGKMKSAGIKDDL